MADHTDHKLTRDTLHGTPLGSIDADFLHRASGSLSFLRAFLNSRGVERFTPLCSVTAHSERSARRQTCILRLCGPDRN
jgi:hypothetical protein